MPDFEKRDKADVQKMFSQTAAHYDTINRAMCFGLDVLWRRALAKTALADFRGNAPQVADLACGSGDVCAELARRDSSARILGIDLCPEMLEIAQRKIDKSKLSDRVKLMRADCENLPLADASFDAITISFGFRNFQNRERALAEIFRVLKPRGRLAVLEVSRAGKLSETAQKIFMTHVVPSIAAAFGGDIQNYKYLANTTLNYPFPSEITAMFAAAGFAQTTVKKFGCGLVAITTGIKNG